MDTQGTLGASEPRYIQMVPKADPSLALLNFMTTHLCVTFFFLG